MLRCRKTFTILIWLSMLASTICSHAEEEIEDLDEAEKGVASLSPYIALLVTGDRAIGFDERPTDLLKLHYHFAMSY